VGATRAASLMGVNPPYITRLKDQGRMPEPVPVEGSADGYVRSEVLALGEELEEGRIRRARRRARERGVPCS
jgi:predicted DNA-binding transcriptional regulator AlpA